MFQKVVNHTATTRTQILLPANISDTSCRPETPHINEIHQQVAEARSTIVNLPRDDTEDSPDNAALAAAKKLLEENKEELDTHA